MARLMVIFSLGGLTLQRHLRGRAVRCSTAVVPIDEPGPIVLDPFLRPGMKGTFESGEAHLWRDGVVVPDPGPGTGLRWTDHQLLSFTGQTLHDWLVAKATATPDGLVHQLTDQCEFGDVVVATRRRSYDRSMGAGRPMRSGHAGRPMRSGHAGRRGVPVLWADLVAAHVIPAAPENALK